MVNTIQTETDGIVNSSYNPVGFCVNTFVIMVYFQLILRPDLVGEFQGQAHALLCSAGHHMCSEGGI